MGPLAFTWSIHSWTWAAQPSGWAVTQTNPRTFGLMIMQREVSRPAAASGKWLFGRATRAWEQGILRKAEGMQRAASGHGGPPRGSANPGLVLEFDNAADFTEGEG